MPPRRRELGVRAGDVFATALPDGRFGAVRVLALIRDGQRPGRDSANVACTAYLGAAPPALDDPALRQILRQRRFAFAGAPAVMIVDEPPPPGFVLIGNFPPAAQEARMHLRGTYGAGWSIAQGVYDEWRWEHDRQALEAEVAAARAAREAVQARAHDHARGATPPARRRTPRSKLTEADFWRLIDLIDRAALAQGDEDAALAPLITALADKGVADIREWHEILAHKLYLLDTRALAAHAGPSGQSDDGFLYARCFVVASGESVHRRVLGSPAAFPADADCEGLLSVADEAFLARTGDDLDHDTFYSYETGSNLAGWP